MSKVGNALKMLVLLKSRGKMKLSELAYELEVDKRQIMRYKEDLEQAGIYINSTSGKYGGYSVEGKDYLLGLNLSDEEYNALIIAQNQLKHDNFALYDDLQLLVEKMNILKNANTGIKDQTDFYIKGFKVNYDYEKERKTWLDINAAIIMNKKIKIEYYSLKNEVRERIVRPYGIFQYKEFLYFVGFCEYRNEIRQFKISRINAYEILNTKFDKDSSFDIKSYMKNSIGIFKDGELNLKLKIRYPLAQIVKEKIWVENQKIEENKESNFIIYEAQMNGITEIKSWILSMGSYVEVLAPKELRVELREEIAKTLNLYNN